MILTTCLGVYVVGCITEESEFDWKVSTTMCLPKSEREREIHVIHSKYHAHNLRLQLGGVEPLKPLFSSIHDCWYLTTVTRILIEAN